MFIGHYAVALAAKKAAPRTSLGTLFIAAQFVDLLWPVLLLLGWEHVRIEAGNTPVTPLDFYDYPISHSLLGALLWSALLSGIYYAFRPQPRGALIIGLCVLSHWILDFLTHRPDLPLTFSGSTKVGAGLWYSVPATVIVESLLFIGGIALYLSVTQTLDRVGVYGFWALIAFLAIIYCGNIFAPTPTDTNSIAIAGNASWLFVLWAYWVDKHRALVTESLGPQ